MKRTATIFAAACLLALLGTAKLIAQASNVTRVAVINMQNAILESEEGKKAAATLKSKYDAKAAELEKMKKEVEGLNDEIKRQEKNLSEEALAQKQRTLDAKNKELTRTGDDANTEFQQLQSEAINVIGNKILRIIQAYASEQNFSLVIDTSLPQSGVLFANPTTDITTEIIRRFDAQSGGGTAPAGKPAPTAGAPAKK
ncbi:MAG: OmpH family outer membrane protein [Acidobacteriia bacterium]|nr:OmpH family outer membrane protein [Terriglobia bacterium]